MKTTKNGQTELMPVESTEVQITPNGIAKQDSTPDGILRLAIDKDLDIDKLERLIALKERNDASEARKKFFSALAGFQSEMGKVTKDSLVDFGAGKAKYKYAAIDKIVDQARPLLFKYNLSYQFKIKDEPTALTVTCILTHSDGHSEETTMSAAPDDTGGKGKIQQRASTITYLQRYTLNSSLGITTGNDTDATPPKININDKAFSQAVDRIKKGETELIEKVRSSFELTESQKETLSNL